MIASVAIVSACFGIAAIITLVTKARRKVLHLLPPGPYGLPFFGKALGFHHKKAHKTFTQWNKVHGDVTMVTMFGKNVVILSHPDVIRKAFVSEEFAPFMNDRPENFVGYYVADGYKDILLREYDETFRKLKSATVRAMHAMGVGSAVYQENLQTEINGFIATVTSYGDRNVDIIKPLELSLCKLVCLLFTGSLPLNEDPLLESIRMFDQYGNQMIQPDIHLVFKLFPFVRHLPGKYGALYRETIKEREKLRQSLITNMKSLYKRKRMDCLTHALFGVQEEEDWLTDDYILGILMDLINTSTLTSRGVLSGIFLLLIHFPEAQRQIRQEIDSIVGSERQPLPEDRANMPYTHAFILETLRYQSHLSLTAAHCNASTDVTLDGFLIPKGSIILGNQWAVHHDERFWSEPWSFKPTRYLNADNTLVPTDHDNRNRNFIPFGVGARSCLGVQKTYNRMFLYVTMLLQKCEIRPPIGESVPSHDPRELTPGTVLQAPDFLCRVIPRDSC